VELQPESALDNEEALFQRFKKIRSDPWEFLKCVFTLDQVDKKNPIKAYPTYLDYLNLYVRVWEKERLLLCPKSRRMKMSWTNIALFTWDAIFHIGRNHAFVSKKEDDSDELVKRARFILDNIDETKLPKSLLPKYEVRFNRLYFPEIQSMIQGFPSGANQLRQFTFSGIMADEMAFWEEAQEMYSAAMPTLEGGGRFTGFSSPSAGFFKKLVFDTLDQGENDEL